MSAKVKLLLCTFGLPVARKLIEIAEREVEKTKTEYDDVALEFLKGVVNALAELCRG